MDVATVAKAQTVNRLGLGAGLVVVPQLLGRIWSGRAASDERTRVTARALGVRDLLLAAGALAALNEGDRHWAERAFWAQAAADAVDLAAVALAGRSLGRPTRTLAGTMAAGSAGVAAAYAWRLRRER